LSVSDVSESNSIDATFKAVKTASQVLLRSPATTPAAPDAKGKNCRESELVNTVTVLVPTAALR
jgi:hypothetical protein